MKRLFPALLVAATALASPAMALEQNVPLQLQIDSAEAQVARVVTGLGNQVAAQANTIDGLRRQVEEQRQQIADLTAERDKLKAAAAHTRPAGTTAGAGNPAGAGGGPAP